MKNALVTNGLDTLVSMLAKDSPGLEDLSNEQLKVLSKSVVYDELKSSLKHKVDVSRVNYKKERNQFLGRFKSPFTYRNYAKGLWRLEEFCSARGISVPELTPALADDFIINQKGRSPASVNLDVAACSAFWTWLERRHMDCVKNPFRGTRERPRKKAVRPLVVPTADEIEAVIDYTKNKLLKAAFVVMMEHGLRVGGLPGVCVRNGLLTTISKCKEVKLKISERALTALKKAGANLNAPFGRYSAQQIKDRCQYRINKCVKVGLIETRFSCHSIRRQFSVVQYENNGHDIVRLRNLLGHHSVAVCSFSSVFGQPLNFPKVYKLTSLPV